MSRLKVFRTRLTTGTLKGRWIDLPTNGSIRPTRDRIRQAAFNMLTSRVDIAGLTVLDFCCGSGAWGLEAYSRGAVQVWVVDTDTRIVARNSQTLGIKNGVSVITADATRWTPPSLANIVLADPPYGSDILPAILSRAGQIGNPGSWWVLECGAEEIPSMDGFTDVQERVYGASKLIIAHQKS